MKVHSIAIVALLAAVCHAHHGHPLLHQIEDVMKLPKEQWESEFRGLLKSRVAAREAKNAIDDAIIAALENLRKAMPTGDPDLGIPPLDPGYIEHEVINFEHRLINLILTLDQTTATKLSEFQIDKISNDLENLKAEFGITLPELHFEGQYIAAGDVPNIIQITGNGSFTLDLTGLATWGTVTLGSTGGTEDGTVFIDTLDIDFTLQALKTGFENFMGGGAVGDLMNDLISEQGPEYLEQLKPDINEYIANVVLGLANPILGHYTLKEILDILGVNQA
ncbi:uncharacterized protein [Periplaneta americana]|uniref:uncharacterized protein n=1 Tax=Periplaneta americana TaxID=6978 RepID=UPI0037E705E0